MGHKLIQSNIPGPTVDARCKFVAQEALRATKGVRMPNYASEIRIRVNDYQAFVAWKDQATDRDSGGPNYMTLEACINSLPQQEIGTRAQLVRTPAPAAPAWTVRARGNNAQMFVTNNGKEIVIRSGGA